MFLAFLSAEKSASQSGETGAQVFNKNHEDTFPIEKTRWEEEEIVLCVQVLTTCSGKHIFASQELRFALLIFTLGIVRRIVVIPAHCHVLDVDSYAPCNDVIFSQSMRGFLFLSFECPEN